MVFSGLAQDLEDSTIGTYHLFIQPMKAGKFFFELKVGRLLLCSAMINFVNVPDPIQGRLFSPSIGLDLVVTDKIMDPNISEELCSEKVKDLYIANLNCHNLVIVTTNHFEVPVVLIDVFLMKPNGTNTNLESKEGYPQDHVVIDHNMAFHFVFKNAREGVQDLNLKIGKVSFIRKPLRKEFF
eukprot:TRINITY_DN12754_c0_g2_i1.p1 TRINITY_DN12754_c0_g2~~TRINITY_DN12754_c0_g2_i1.p1  ORF type:complete len:183 (+),score=29.00 TRINITY_DN12754_c0_g2_i1:692-1240(+)